MYVAIKDNDGEITTGAVDQAEVGQVVTVKLHDENGMPIQASGVCVEVF